MTIVDSFPDAEALAGWHVRQSDLEELGPRVYSSLPDRKTYPLARIQRVGGLPAERHRLDRPNLQVDVWGDSSSQAFDVAQLVRAALFDMEGRSFRESEGAPASGFVAGVVDTLGMTFLPDETTSKDRYTFAVALTIHAIVDES
jgi:hypothetical protein